MNWITRLTIDNYRAFPVKKSIEIPYKHHLLIYGENGSGKSSVYHALMDFLASSDNYSINFNLNRFCKDAAILQGHIEIDISDGTNINTYRFDSDNSKSTNRNHGIRLANKAKGFLDYKRILKAHALDVKPTAKPDIFDLLVHELLCLHRVANPAGGTGTVQLLEKYDKLSTILRKTRRNARIYIQSIAELSKLNAELLSLLKRVFEEANRYLAEYFKNVLRLDLNYTPLNVTSHKTMVERIELRVFFGDKEISDYHVFLNEARLSAIALSLYLASVKVHPEDSTIHRILFLDDVFIGLDMSNRIPLLEILKNEFASSAFQILIATYDRQWFDLAHNWFATNQCKVKTIEMYIGRGDATIQAPEYPVIIARTPDYYQTAKAHFELHDYPAAANCLRKACEKEMKRILPKHLTLQANNENGEIHKIDKLQSLADNFIDYIKKHKLDLAPFAQFNTYKKIILNPLSHDDLEAPHYRREIEAGISIVEALRDFKVRDVHSSKEGKFKPLKFGVKDTTSEKIHIYLFQFKENLRYVKQGTADPVFLQTEFDLKENNSARTFTDLHTAFDTIRTERGYPNSSDYNVCYNNVKVTNTKKLIDFMQFT